MACSIFFQVVVKGNVAFMADMYHSFFIPITIKENLLTYSGMFSEQTAPIGTYDIPMDSDLHGEGP